MKKWEYIVTWDDEKELSDTNFEYGIAAREIQFFLFLVYGRALTSLKILKTKSQEWMQPTY